MYRIKTIVMLLLATIALSCNKRYNCVCVHTTNAAAGEVAGISKEVTGKDRAEAEAKCKRLGDPGAQVGGCVLQ